MTQFAYCWIPVSDAESYKEIIATRSAESSGDQLLTLLKANFADGGAVDDEQVQKQYGGTLLGGVDASALSASTASGSCEAFPLVQGSASNGNCCVNMYIDEIGVLKNLPVNVRASALAKCCGHDVSLHGDVYIGRTQTDASGSLANADFKLGDLDSSASWVQTAHQENLQRMQSFKSFQDNVNSKGGFESVEIAKNPERDDDVNGTRGYTWIQTEEDIEFTMKLAAGMTAKSLSVSILPKALKVASKMDGSQLKELSLFAAIRPDDSTWTVSSGSLQVTLEKVVSGKWPHLEKM